MLNPINGFAESRVSRYLAKIVNAASTGFAGNYYAFRPSIRYWRCYESESYWLVGYLLAQSTSGKFHRWECWRRLWRFIPISSFVQRALGGKAKSELRNWRMAQSLLNSVEGHENITQLAVNHGYHRLTFSSEIKELDRRFRREISNIIQLADKWRQHILYSAGMCRACSGY